MRSGKKISIKPLSVGPYDINLQMPDYTPGMDDAVWIGLAKKHLWDHGGGTEPSDDAMANLLIKAIAQAPKPLHVVIHTKPGAKSYLAKQPAVPITQNLLNPVIKAKVEEFFGDSPVHGEGSPPITKLLAVAGMKNPKHCQIDALDPKGSVVMEDLWTGKLKGSVWKWLGLELPDAAVAEIKADAKKMWPESPTLVKLAKLKYPVVVDGKQFAAYQLNKMLDYTKAYGGGWMKAGKAISPLSVLPISVEADEIEELIKEEEGIAKAAKGFSLSAMAPTYLGIDLGTEAKVAALKVEEFGYCGDVSLLQDLWEEINHNDSLNKVYDKDHLPLWATTKPPPFTAPLMAHEWEKAEAAIPGGPEMHPAKAFANKGFGLIDVPQWLVHSKFLKSAGLALTMPVEAKHNNPTPHNATGVSKVDLFARSTHVTIMARTRSMGAWGRSWAGVVMTVTDGSQVPKVAIMAGDQNKDWSSARRLRQAYHNMLAMVPTIPYIQCRGCGAKGLVLEKPNCQYSQKPRPCDPKVGWDNVFSIRDGYPHNLVVFTRDEVLLNEMTHTLTDAVHTGVPPSNTDPGESAEERFALYKRSHRYDADWRMVDAAHPMLNALAGAASAWLKSGGQPPKLQPYVDEIKALLMQGKKA